MAVRVAGVAVGAVATALIARALQPEKFGEYAFVMALVMIASIPPTAGLRQTLAREIAYATARADAGHLAAVWFWALRWALLATVGVAAAIAAWAVWGVQDPDLRRHLLYGAGILFLLPVPRVMSGALQGFGKVVASQIPEFLLRPVATLVLVIPLWALTGPGGVSVGAVLLVFAAAVVVDGLASGAFLAGANQVPLRAGRAAQTPLDRSALRVSALSFGAIASVALINNNLDVVMLGLLATDTDTGVYKAAAILSELVVFGLGVINAVILPRIAGLHARGDHAGLQALVTRSARTITAFALAGGLILLVGGELLLGVIFGAGYVGGYTVLAILALGQLANALFGPVAIVLNMTGHERVTLVGMSVSLVVNAGLNLVLIPPFGITGAAVATATTLVFWNLLLAVALRRRTGIKCSVLGQAAG